MLKFVIIGIVLYLAFSVNTIAGVVASLLAIGFILYWNIPFFYARNGSKAFNENDFQKALSEYEKAYKTGRASADTILTYGILLLRNGKPQEAVTIFNLVIMNTKNKDDYKKKAKQYRALAYYKLGNADDALDEAEEVFDKYRNTVSYGLLGYLKIVTKAAADEIFAFCKEGYEYNSDDRDICDNFAYACIRTGRFDQAKKIIAKMLEKFPTFTEAYYHGAMAYFMTGDYKTAVDLLDQIEDKCIRTYLTTISEDDIEDLRTEIMTRAQAQSAAKDGSDND